MGKARSSVSVAERDRRRAVRFLGGGPARLEPAARGGTVLLCAAERGTVSLCAEAVNSLLRDGMIVRSAETVSLTGTGKAGARRAAAVEEPYRAQHLDLGHRQVVVAGGVQKVQANLGESPLAQLARRRTRKGEPFLSPSEFDAGERLRADYARGQIMPRLSAGWMATAAAGRGAAAARDGIAGLTDAALAARQRVDGALTAVGPELAGVLVDTCCFLKGFEQIEFERGWPVRSAKVVLKTALSVLARHYDGRAGKAAGRRRPILHWGGTGYRPRIA